MSYNLLKGKRGIIFGALNEQSIAWMCVRNVHMMIWITICWKRRWIFPLSLSTR